jgi:hypothetical protein
LSTAAIGILQIFKGMSWMPNEMDWIVPISLTLWFILMASLVLRDYFIHLDRRK